MAHAPAWVLFCVAPFFAATGSQSTLSRARWSHIVPDKHALNTAFSLESSLEEVLYIAGPALATILATTVASWLPSIIAAATLLVGGYVFLSLRATEPPARKADAGTVPLTMAPVIDGSLHRVGISDLPPPGRVDTGTPSGAISSSPPPPWSSPRSSSRRKGRSSLLSTPRPSPSRTSSATRGGRAWCSRSSPSVRSSGDSCTAPACGRARSRRGCCGGSPPTGIGAALFHLAPNLVVLAALMFATGLVIAPTMAVGDGVVHALVPRSRVTEGMAWTRVGLDMGVAAGAWLAGLLIDRGGAADGFAVTTAAGVGGPRHHARRVEVPAPHARLRRRGCARGRP